MWAAVSGMAVGVCAAALAAALFSPAARVRGGEEPGGLPPWMRLLWPWVRAAALAAGPLLTHGARARIERALSQAGLAARVRAEDLAGLQVSLFLLAGGAGAMAGWVGMASAGAAAACALPPAIVGGGFPRFWLRERAGQRRARIERELPFALDMATLCIEAGLNLQGALQQAAARGPEGPLREELSLALAEMRAGMPRLQALRDMALRTGAPGLRTVVSSLAQADALGMSLGPVLRVQAESLRGRRFLRAERLALEAPVKMLFPLIACIFPCTFLVIGFPILVKLLEFAS